MAIDNRETGAGCRQLLERLLVEAGVSFEAVQGFDQVAYSHWEVAQVIASGKVDAGVSNAAIATAFNLDFIPLHQSRYDLVVLKDYLELAPVERLFSQFGLNRFCELVAQGCGINFVTLKQFTQSSFVCFSESG